MSDSAGCIIDTIGLPERLFYLRIRRPEVRPYYVSHRAWAAAREDGGVDKSPSSALALDARNGEWSCFSTRMEFWRGTGLKRYIPSIARR